MKRSVTIWALVFALVTIQAAWAAPELAQGLGVITSPRDGAEVRGLVPIEGSATHPQFQKYEIHYGPQPNPGDQWTPVGQSPFSVPVVQGRLALWDTTVIPDGQYSLRLRLVRLDGNYDEYFVRGIQVVNTRPVATPTREATPTPSRPTADTDGHADDRHCRADGGIAYPPADRHAAADQRADRHARADEPALSECQRCGVLGSGGHGGRFYRHRPALCGEEWAGCLFPVARPPRAREPGNV